MRESFTGTPSVRTGAAALLHSPRAAALFAALIDDARIGRADIRLVAISPAAAAAAGPGWRSVAVAPAPETTDAVVEQDGARVFLDVAASVALGDKVLDAQVDEGGSVTFGITPQG